MGKKGKARQDKFYHLAKETGYRSRASFKLLQLNRKFEFLEKCRVCIDLCAAPGSWMQVAKQHMPVSSLIVGIDLFPIKPIPGCIALQEDITTEKCRQSIKKELKTWKADIVLHDGAPNVGQNWIYDAFVQNQLVLSALKLATEFLVPGGWFVTKVFRSKDYQSLVWVLQQLFKKVHSTKPMASRMESAEIFVVCQGYKAPDKLDPKFLDPKHVFQEIEEEEDQPVLKSEKKEKPRAEGYEDGVTVLHKSVPVRNFVSQENFIHVLNTAIEIVMDDPEIASHPLTTDEVKECCKDIRVLGRKDLKALLTWRKAVKEDLEKKAKAADKEESEAPAETMNDVGDDSSDGDEELSKIDQQVDSLKAEQERDLRRKKKKIARERKKLQQKMNLKIVLPGDSGPVQQEKSLFSLTQIKSGKDLSSLEDQGADFVVDSDEDADAQVPKLKKLRFEKDGGHIDSSGRFYRGEEDSDEELSFEGSDDEYDGDVQKDTLGFDESDGEAKKDETPNKKVRFSDTILVKEIPNKAKGKLPQNGASEAEKPENEEEQGNPLITDLFHGDQNQRRKRKADLWFDKDVFKNVEDEADEDAELDLMAVKYLAKPLIGVNGTADKTSNKKKKKSQVEKDDEVSDNEDDDSESDDSDSSDSSGSDFDVNEDFAGKSKKKAKKSGSMEIVPQEKGKGRKLSLTPEALALGSMMIHSKKAKRDILDEGWNRYMFNDTVLPEWFVEDERRHNHADLPVTKELVDEYRNRQREVNVRPIKKVVEAKARKKKRALRKVEKAKKKASSIAENMGLSDYDKAQQIRQIYKKALQEKKKDVTYVVAKKGQTGRKATRPQGVQGRYKMVDRRMKKDNRSKKAAERKKRGKPRKSKK